MSAEDSAKQVLSKVGIWWPAGDEGRARQAAQAWTQMAGALDDVAALGGRAHSLAREGYDGAAASAFTTFWRQYDGGPDAYLPASAGACRALADACTRYADAMAQAKHKLEELAAEIGATVVVGTVLAIFTFGASEVAAAGVSAGLIAAADAVGLAVSGVVADIVATGLTAAAFGAVESAALDVAIAQPLRVEVFHDGGYSAGEIKDWAVGGAIGGGAFGAGAKGLSALRAARNTTGALRAPLSQIAPPQQGMPVWRVYGEAQDGLGGLSRGSRPFGESWTPADPATSSDFRVQAGLPNENPGRFLVEGRLSDPSAVTQVRPALPLDGNPGGWPEYLIPDADRAVDVVGVSGLNEPWTRQPGQWAP